MARWMLTIPLILGLALGALLTAHFARPEPVQLPGTIVHDTIPAPPPVTITLEGKTKYLDARERAWYDRQIDSLLHVNDTLGKLAEAYRILAQPFAADTSLTDSTRDYVQRWKVYAAAYPLDHRIVLTAERTPLVFTRPSDPCPPFPAPPFFKGFYLQATAWTSWSNNIFDFNAKRYTGEMGFTLQSASLDVDVSPFAASIINQTGEIGWKLGARWYFLK